mgnify:CR=1 FL=1|tara:strand:- start:2719 stop:3051 length:333 start_codon:yes stop_codon:yes gene_type:complete
MIYKKAKIEYRCISCNDVIRLSGTPLQNVPMGCGKHSLRFANKMMIIKSKKISSTQTKINGAINKLKILKQQRQRFLNRKISPDNLYLVNNSIRIKKTLAEIAKLEQELL